MGRVTRDRSGQPACPPRPGSRPLRVWKGSPAQRSLPDRGQGSPRSLQSSTCRGGIKPISQMRGRTGQGHAARRLWRQGGSRSPRCCPSTKHLLSGAPPGRRPAAQGEQLCWALPMHHLVIPLRPPEIQARSAPTYR